MMDLTGCICVLLILVFDAPLQSTVKGTRGIYFHVFFSIRLHSSVQGGMTVVELTTTILGSLRRTILLTAMRNNATIAYWILIEGNLRSHAIRL